MNPLPDKQSISTFHKRLTHWYETHGRKDLPWRNTRDPYAIYVSEIMLQQTQVKTVLERYYFQFLKRFPTMKALASAPRDDVLAAWQGLGYYTRAKNLHEAAQALSLPSRVEQLMHLPGIGRNTAHAIAAFAYRQPVAVMEANVKRVLSRLFALTQPADATLWTLAQALVDMRNPFDYNQAMMDIGAMVCTRRAPQCSQCPAAHFCKGKSNPERYPAPKAKKSTPVRRKQIMVRRNARGEYYATPRKDKFLHGLYHFVETDAGTPPVRATKIGYIRQQYSHFTLEADVFLQSAKGSGNSWFSLARLKKLPMSMAEKKILALLDGLKTDMS